jgi:DnaK suppressor protein
MAAKKKKKKAKASKPARKKKAARRPAAKTRKKKAPARPKKKAAARPTARKAATRKAAAPARPKRAPSYRRDDAFFDHFRRRLLEDRQQIVRRLDELREELSGLEETPREMEEWAQEEKDRDILIRLEERETEELRKITAALTLIDAREYGKCQVCGKPIPRARLEELPTAFRCVDCTP